MHETPEPTVHVLIPHRILVTSLFIATMVGGSLFSLKTVLLLGHPVSGGIWLLPLAYSLLVVVSEVYGVRAADWCVISGLVSLCLIATSLEATVHMPGPASDANDRIFDHLYAFAARPLLAAIVSFAAGQYATVVAVRIFLRTTGRRLLALRLYGAPAIAQCVTILLFASLALTGDMTTRDLWAYITDRWALAILESAAVMPVVWFVILWLRRAEWHRLTEGVRNGSDG